MGIAPKPEEAEEAIVQVYAARTFGWRRYFAAHTWIATKSKSAPSYITYHVTAWGARVSGKAITIKPDIPDRRWYGADAVLIAEIRGEKAEHAILKIESAVKEYPYHNFYRMIPGPNSNSFVSFILRRTPEIGVELPPHAIGRDWINRGSPFGISETGTGFQFSLFGVLGFTVGLADGLELNLLMMTFGLDFLRPALKLPFVGRVGFNDAPVSF